MTPRVALEDSRTAALRKGSGQAPDFLNEKRPSVSKWVESNRAISINEIVNQFMKHFSRPIFGAASIAVAVAAILAAVQLASPARETVALPEFNIQNTPVQRGTGSVASYAPTIKKAAPSVVNIYTTRTIRMRRQLVVPFFDNPLRRFFDGNPNDQRGRTLTRKEKSLGSGVIVSSDGYILTANHVVEGADPDSVKVALASGAKEFTAQVIGTDPPTDVAVLKIDAHDLPSITQADSDQLQVGDVVLAIGNPFDVGQTVTMGIVSALGRSSLGLSDYEDFIQTDAAINPGNSGGALVDAEGRLVGINTAIFTLSGGYQGVGFAIPVNLARSVMERLIQSGKVTRGYLGVSLQPDISPDLAEEFNLPDQSGAMISAVQSGTPASQAGLLNGDVIREVDGKKIADEQQLRLMISQSPPGSKVALSILRSEPGEKPVEKKMTVTLDKLPDSRMAQRGSVRPRGQDSSTPDSLDGVEVMDLDSDVRSQLQVPRSVRGAVVASVDANSNAADAGLQEGDIIQEIDRHPVRNADDAVRLSEQAKGKRVLLRLWRQGGSLYLTVDNRKD